MKSYRIIASIAAIAIVTMIVSSMLATTASAISDTGTGHAQQPGTGVCNADDKIHNNAPPQADEGFHGGVEKNFGPPSNFVGPTSTCQNVLPPP
jgi:hypothetical protein